MMSRPVAFELIDDISLGSEFEDSDQFGNAEPGDGQRYRGAGAQLLTGRAAYAAFAEAVGDDRILEGADVVVERYPYSSAAYRWFTRGANDDADTATSPSAFCVSMRFRSEKASRRLIEAYGRAVAAFPDPG